jgi:molecular chaperone DnaK
VAPNEALVRIQLRYPDEQTFIARFAPNVTRGGIFLASRRPKPVGEIIRFEVALAQGPALLWGTGRVTWVREFNPAEPHRAHGMGVQFTFIDPECRPLLEKLLESKCVAPQPTTTTDPVPTARVREPSAPRTVQASVQSEPLSVGECGEVVDDATLRRALDRARTLAGRTDLGALLARGDDESPTLPKALADLPRLVHGRRTTSSFRVVADAEDSNKGDK